MLIHWVMIFLFTASFFKKDQDGSSQRAALLSGSPGVGKTTTATLVCEELGFSYIEMNASDTRNKKTLEEHISQSLSNKTMDGFLPGKSAIFSYILTQHLTSLAVNQLCWTTFMWTINFFSIWNLH